MDWVSTIFENLKRKIEVCEVKEQAMKFILKIDNYELSKVQTTCVFEKLKLYYNKKTNLNEESKE